MGIDTVINSYYDALAFPRGASNMRGFDEQPKHLFSYISIEQRVPATHPLRSIRQMTDRVLANLSAQFTKMYAKIGRPSIPPEKLLRALRLQVLYTVRSERLLMEHLEYNLLFRWFVGLEIDDPVWDATVFTKNRDRLLAGDVAATFFQAVRAEAEARQLTSDDHFTVDGTLLEAWASLKSLKKVEGDDGPPPDAPGNPTVNFHGETRTNATHASTTDPDARLARKGAGKEAKLSYTGHILMENRNGLAVDVAVLPATGTAEREAAIEMIAALPDTGRITLGGDKNYDTQDFVAQLRELEVTPHVAQNDTNRRSAIDGRTTHHAGYAISQQKRKRIEEIFGWLKTVGGLRKLRHRGHERVTWMFTFAVAVYNLVRIRKLEATG
jgi:transposase